MFEKYSIKEKVIGEIEVEKSKFYGILAPFNDAKELSNVLNDIKKEYPKARHYCYAFITDKEKKISDDGEPSGTAGKPMLNMLEYANLENVILVIVRYFGGKLLGSGRLLRTYSETAKTTINKAKLYKIVNKTKIRISIANDIYNDFIKYANKNSINIINKHFSDTILLDILCDKDFNEDIENIFKKKLSIIGKIDVSILED